ncbi:hypothetical protein GCG21_09295 [Pseudactinotalea sp. HY160]|uniref:ABC transporter permease subunit n=1 Tax=Pseudactinotalea sp. HY160 TaxID=2654490 RepID=UPI00128CAD15|nr:ABC transporter permease subunit [Pseudactinotalea sp. HY160]MPV50194.1 hypothetical protein [Pseudactinotalea sp. HY160]
MRLLRVELRRLRLRGLVRIASVLGLLGAILLVGIAVLDARPATAEDIAWAEQMYQEERANWEEHGQEQIEQCELAEASESEIAGEQLDFGCDDMEPRLEWYLPPDPVLTDYLASAIRPFTILLTLLVGLLIGATAIAAEFGAGSMSTLLTFEPRRRRVYLAKTGAAVLGTIPLGLVMVALTFGGVCAVFALRGLEADVPSSVIWSWVRLVAVLPAAAAVGAVVGFLLRSTAAVLGTAVGYVIAVEAIVRFNVPALAPWIPGVNLAGWVSGGTTYYLQECTRSSAGLMCEAVEQSISFGWSAGFLAVLLAVLVTLGGWNFARRDVN